MNVSRTAYHRLSMRCWSEKGWGGGGGVGRNNMKYIEDHQQFASHNLHSTVCFTDNVIKGYQFGGNLISQVVQQ